VAFVVVISIHFREYDRAGGVFLAIDEAGYSFGVRRRQSDRWSIALKV